MRILFNFLIGDETLANQIALNCTSCIIWVTFPSSWAGQTSSTPASYPESVQKRLLSNQEDVHSFSGSTPQGAGIIFRAKFARYRRVESWGSSPETPIRNHPLWVLAAIVTPARQFCHAFGPL
jgi:hypothetical protein